MATVNFVIPVHQKKKDGTINAKIRVTHKGRSKWIPTSVYVSTADLSRAGKLKDRTVEMHLEDLCRDLRGIVSRLSPFALDAMAVEDVVRYIVKEKERQTFAVDFVEFGKEFAASQSESMRKETLKALSAFSRFRGGVPTDVNEITASMLLDFVAFVNGENKYVYNRWKDEPVKTSVQKRKGVAAQRYFMKLKAVYNAAKLRYNDEDAGDIRIPKDPFARVTLPRRSVPEGQRNLGVEVIQRMICSKPVRLNQRYALDMFLLYFSCMGTNLKDFFDAPPFDGKFAYERSKTRNKRPDRAYIRMTVPPEVAPAVERLRDKTGRYWLSLHNKGKDADAVGTKINNALKTWARNEGLEPFTLYAARHSWASIARSNAKIDKATVDECLNHVGSMAMADIYIEKDFDLLDESNRKVMALFDWTPLKDS